MSSFMSRFGLSSGTKKTSESPAAPKQQLNTSIGMGVNQNSRNAYMGTSVGPVKANTQIGAQYTQGAGGVGYSSNPPSQTNKQQHLLTISNMGGVNSTYLDSSAMYNN
jgi:hypothetical protein